MPQAIGFLIAGAGGVGATVMGVTAGLGAVIAFQATSLVIMTAVSRKLADRKLKNQQPVSNERQFTVRAADTTETFIYGKAWVSGLTVYHNAINHPASTYDTPNYDMMHVVRWACHRVNCIQMFRLDDEILDPSVDSISWNPVTYTGSGVVETGKFRGTSLALSPTLLRWYLGDQTEVDGVMDFFYDEWGSAHVGRERAYGVFHVTQINKENNTDKVFQNGIPQNIQAYVHGKSVFDSRKNALSADPTFLNPSSCWNGFSQNSGDLTWQTTANCWEVVNGVGGPLGNAIDRAIAVTNAASMRFLASVPFPVSASSQFSLKCVVRQPSLPVGSGQIALGLSFWDGNGVNIPVGSSNATGFTLSTFHYFYSNTNAPPIWTDMHIKIGSGQTHTVPSCASFARLIVIGNVTGISSTTQQVQEFVVWMGSGSRQLVDVASTWTFSDNPAYCTADYLRNEVFGFGKEMRLRINGSRYSKNLDPGWRRVGTLSVTSFWKTSVLSGQGSALSSINASLTQVTGAPVGRTALVLSTSASSPADPGVIASVPIPIDPSGVYFATVRARQDGTRGNTFGVHYLTATGASIGGTQMLATQQLSAVWSKYTLAVGSGTSSSIPSSARFISLFATIPNSMGANGATNLYLQDFRLMVGSQDKLFVEPWEQINWASVSSAAGYCDYVVATPSGAQARFTCNGAGHTGQSYRDVLRDLSMSGNLRLVYTQSGWNMYGGWGQPAFELNRGDIKGPIEVRGAAATADRYNTVRGTFFDRHEYGKRVPFGTMTVAEYRARDNSMQLFEDLEMNYTHDWWEAQRVAMAVLEQGDNQMVATVPVGMRGFGLAVGQHVSIQNNVMSWSPKYFMLTGAEYDVKPGTTQGVRLRLREDFQSSYIDPSMVEYVPRSLGLITSMAPNVPMPGSLQVIPRIEAVELRWVNPAQRAFEWIDVYKATTNSFGASQLIASVRGNVHVDDHRVSDQVLNWYYLRARDFDGNVSSVYPGVSSGVSGGGVFASPRDPEYAFFDEFNYKTIDQFEQRWEENYTDHTTQTTFPYSGVIGGQVLQVDSGEVRYTSRYRIPFDPEALYRMTVRARRISSLTHPLYVGVVAYKADGSTPISVTSIEQWANAHYYAGHAVTPSSLGEWNIYEGLLRGTMPWPRSGSVWLNISKDPMNAARAHPLTRYISPHLAMNVGANAFGGSWQIDYVSISKEEFPSNLVLDRHITMGASQWMTQYPGDRPIENHYTIALNSEYNYLGVNSQVAGSINVFERVNTKFHTIMPNSWRITWQARLYVSSMGGTPPIINILTKAWTRTETVVGAFITAVPATPGLGNFAFDKWVDISGEAVGSISSSALSFYNGHRYMTVGIEFSSATNARSIYISYLDARLV